MNSGRRICSHGSWSDECMTCADESSTLHASLAQMFEAVDHEQALPDVRRTHVEFTYGVPKVHRAPVREEPAQACSECHTRGVAVEVSYLDCQVEPPVPIASLFCGRCVHVETLAFKGYIRCKEKRLTWLGTEVSEPDYSCSICGEDRGGCRSPCMFA